MKRPSAARSASAVLFGCALLLAAFLIPSVAAQDGAVISIDQVVVSDDSREAAAFISVLDGSGRPIPGLTGFTVAVDGARVEPDAVEPLVSGELGIAVLVLIDNSGSMAGAPFQQSIAAARSFVGGLLPNDVAAVLPFAGSAPDSAAFTGDGAALVATVEALAIEGETGSALYDTVFNSLAAVRPAPNPRRAVVLLTDGRDSGDRSARSRDEALERAGTSGVPFFTIALGPDADRTLLQQIADASHGQAYVAPAPEELAAIFDAIGFALRSQYALTLPLSLTRTSTHELTVTVDLEGRLLTAQTTFEADATVPLPAPAAGGGVSPLVFVGAAFGALVLGASGYAALRARRRVRLRRSPIAGGPGDDLSAPASQAPSAAPGAPGPATLTVVAGPDAGRSVAVQGSIDIGAGADCPLRLDPAGGAVAARHTRVWLQQDALMVHHLARGKQTLVAGKSVEWARIEQGESVQIGPHVIAFALAGPLPTETATEPDEPRGDATAGAT